MGRALGVAQGLGVLGRNELLLAAGLIKFPEFKPSASWEFPDFPRGAGDRLHPGAVVLLSDSAEGFRLGLCEKGLGVFGASLLQVLVEPRAFSVINLKILRVN